MVKKFLGGLVIAFLVYYVVHNPASAAATTRNLAAGLGNVASRFGDFFVALTSRT